MSIKSVRLNRRSFLRGIGVVGCLPYMECMASSKAEPQTPKRLCYIYVPNGVSLPGLDSAYQEWHWFPRGSGKDYQTTNVLKSLDPLRRDLSIISGLSHPKSRELMGHIAGDTWLTGGDVRAEYRNTISVDQVAANIKKAETRYPSLILSADGGVGFKSRASTLSYDNNGNAMPSEHRHRQIFERYFSPNGQSSSAQRRLSLQRGQKLVDLLLEDAKRLQKRLGSNDKQRLEAHMASLNTLEEQIQRNEAWLNIPLQDFNADHIDLEVMANISPQSYIRSMLDLMVLGFQIDITRVSSFMVAREDGMGFGENYPKIALGLKKGHHRISHDKSTGHWLEWGRYDQWLTSQFAYFLSRMKETPDTNGSLLDNTQILYGSACSNTHNARNYPLILAGGKNMGLKHGTYTTFDDKTPLSNLFVKMLQSADVPVSQFADSNKHLHNMNTLFSV